MGSVFSPHYSRALAQRPQTTSPWAHCALNVALYRPGRSHWALSEYETRPDPTRLQLGASRVAWRQGALHVQVDERTAPWGRPLRGEVILQPQGPSFAPQRLHPSRPHHWCPVAPCARVQVHFDTPGVRWTGRAYHDANWGNEPLGRAFMGWHWQRTWHPEGTWVHYAPRLRDAPAPAALSTLYRPDGSSLVLPAPDTAPLPRSAWGVERQGSGAVRELRRLEDTPFYSRSHVEIALPHGRAQAMHEQLDLQRYNQPWVQFLLPFRIRRG